jgi:hypothetical protein
MERLEYMPPAVGEALTFRAYYPLSSVDKLTHLVPREGLELKPGSSAVQQVMLADDGENGVAAWVIVPRQPLETTELTIRHQHDAVAHRVHVDGRTYAPPLQAHGDHSVLATEVVLTPARFLGIVPGVTVPGVIVPGVAVPGVAAPGATSPGLPPWVVAYLLLALALVWPVRKLLRVW